MFSIQKWFARDDEFFSLLIASAQAGRDSVQALKQILQNPEATHTLEDFISARRKDKTITHRITELLARTTVTSLDPEDIEAISNALYKIPKTAQKIAERFLICGPQLRGIDFTAQIALAEKATDTITGMMHELEKSEFEKINISNESLQTIESDADQLMVDLYRQLYSGKYPPMTVTILKDLYELLERVIDRCRDAGNVTANVVLKHS
jgi:uncharacterized protein Yka (UPF0111/DUF47 family)